MGLVMKKTGNWEMNWKLHSLCVLCGLRAGRTLGAAATVSPWLTLAGVGLQWGRGNTHSKAKTGFFFSVCKVGQGQKLKKSYQIHILITAQL